MPRGRIPPTAWNGGSESPTIAYRPGLPFDRNSSQLLLFPARLKPSYGVLSLLSRLQYTESSYNYITTFFRQYICIVKFSFRRKSFARSRHHELRSSAEVSAGDPAGECFSKSMFVFYAIVSRSRSRSLLEFPSVRSLDIQLFVSGACGGRVSIRIYAP